MISTKATKEEFIKLNCSNCKFDNEDNDPVCDILIKILEGIEIKKLTCCNFVKNNNFTTKKI